MNLHTFIKKSVVQVKNDFNTKFLIPAFRRKGEEDVCELEACLAYIVGSRTGKTT